MKILSTISIILFVLTHCNILVAQKVALNDRGEKIVVFDDGTWRPYVDKDSILLQNNSSEEFLIKDNSEISVLELPPDADVSTGKLSKKKRSAEYKALEQELTILENKLYKFSLDPSIPETDLALLRVEIQKTKEKLSLLNEQGTTAVKKEPKIVSQNDVIASEVKENRESSSFYPPRDFITNPPIKSCDFALNTVDGFDKRRRVEMRKELLFSYTDPKLKPHLKGNEFLTCEIHLNEVAPYRFLNMHFIFSTLTAKREYGELAESTAISFLLVNGQTVTLKNTTNDPGAINTKKSTTEYKALLSISSAAENAFLRSPIDKIRIVWSTGFEDYEVFNVDVLMNQLNCLNSFN